jgi:hypothetical protein
MIKNTSTGERTLNEERVKRVLGYHLALTQGDHKMAAEEERLTPAIINALRRHDPSITQAQIAREYGVTRQRVSQIFDEYARSIERSPKERERAMQRKHWPFPSGARFHGGSIEIRMRDHLRYAANGTEWMSKRTVYLLGRFYHRLAKENVVVEFDPSIPPGPGASTGGWAFVPRTPEDKDLIFRVNEHTRDLDETDRLLWRLPKEFPGA